MGCFAQLPTIKVISKTSGSMEQVITLTGSGFGSDATQLVVMFGAVRADVISVTDQVLTVSIPAGTTYDEIAVTNLASNLTGYTDDQFLLSFHGDTKQPLDASKLMGQYDFPTSTTTADGLYDICTCDFDGDRKNDLAVTNDNSAFLNIYRNTGTTPGTVAFNNKIALNISTRTVHAACGDLNGDGRPDLAVTEKGSTDKVFFLRNNSSGAGSFSFTTQSLQLAGKTPQHVKIADLDLDGKPELIISSQASNNVIVLPNKSTKAAILFDTPMIISFAGALHMDALAVEDLNGDRFPEIIVSQYQTASDIYVVSNSSIPGAISFSNTTTINAGAIINHILAADFDNDGKKDIAYSRGGKPGAVSILLNQSSGSQIAFSSAQTIATDDDAWGLSTGDLNGDGNVDLVAASATKKSITVLTNYSTTGNLSFQSFSKSTTYINRHIVITDVDSDGKPDIAFTSIDDNKLNIPASKVSVFRNRSCMIPDVTPAGPLNVCAGNAVNLVATQGGGINYAWTNQTTAAVTYGTNTFTPTVSGNYNVTALAENGSCSPVSNTVAVTIGSGTATSTQPANNGPVCLNQKLILSLGNDLGSGFSYQWKNAQGNVVGTGASITISPVKLSDAGTYSVEVYAGDLTTGCLARTDFTTVSVTDIPDFSVTRSTGEVICANDLSTLSVYPDVSGFTYQWYERTAGIIPSQTGKKLTRGTSGEYYYQATSSNTACPVATSSSATLNVVNPPTVVFDAPATACQGQEITFKNSTQVAAEAEVLYLWDFGDGQTSTDNVGIHTYASAGTFTVKLTVSYKGQTCQGSATKSIQISAAIPPVITSNTGAFDYCDGKDLTLQLTTAYNSYHWNTGSSDPTLTVTQAGTYFVEVTDPSGCLLKTTQIVTAIPAPIVTATVTPDAINEGETAQLEASGLVNYTWEPATGLSDPTIPDPTASPATSTVYTVEGKDSNGCIGKATVQVVVKGAIISNKLKPSLFFSPNGDNSNPYWIVENILDYPQCGITIFDEKGVQVYKAQPYLNDWDGTFNGKPLQDGVYFFIIRCDGQEAKPRTGSITLLR
ncbi:MAG TPA: FG-GAP-like repeat-containing protein [Ohtaekwangia sp.]|uniref:FG-GAP-like repeat-containing protein n=1 Tax=Ohtaekwangia sp. TaxID=2066019 RepID=UPI002F93DC2F